MKKINKINKLLILGIATFPGVVFAIDFKTFLGKIAVQLNAIPAFLFGLAILYLLWNITKYIQSGDPKKKDEAREMITYSIIFLFVMVSVWGLVNLLVGTFNLDSGPLKAPGIPVLK